MRVPSVVFGLAALVALVGCDSTGPTATGTIKASVTTTGGDWDLDGYEVLVDGKPVGSVGVNGTVELGEIRIGSHSVELAGIAENCELLGLNRRSVGINGGETSTVAFTVQCTATGVRVTLEGTGVDFGLATYRLMIDGAPPVSLPFGETLTVTYMAPGTHSVALSPAPPANCTLSPDPAVEALVSTGSVTQVTFSLACTALTGVLEVFATTVGADLDPDGYLLSLDGNGAWVIGANAVQRFPSLSPGDHQLDLTGLASNCALTGAPSRTLAITIGSTKRDTARTAFEISCTEIPKSVRFIVTTSGTNLDDAYTLKVDQSCYEYYWYGNYCSWLYTAALGGSDTTSFNLSAGSHQFLLEGVATNCTVAGANPRSATVVEGATVEVAFQVACAAPTTLRVSTSTSGVDQPASYTLQVDGVDRASVAANGAAVSLEVGVGTHAVELTGIPGNCAVSGANPVFANLPAGVTTDVVFTVACQPLGAVRVSAPTSGADLDTYYAAQLDAGGWVGFSSVSSVLFPATPGMHTVTLYQVDPNCAVSGPNPVTISVSSSIITDVVMPVTCAPNPTLQVTIATSGSNLDAGFVVGIDPDWYYGYAYTFPVGNNGVYQMRLPPGSHQVYLEDIAGNCSLAGGNGIPVDMALGSTVDVAFSVTCN